MNLIKAVRKPYFSLFLASLVLFISCSQYDNEIVEINEPLSLANYTEQHLQLMSEISILLESEINIDIKSLESISKDLRPTELSGILEHANFKEADAISELLLKINDNNLNYINSNPDLKALKSNEIEKMITTEIDKQWIQFNSYKSSSCDSDHKVQTSRCRRNAAIGASASVLVGFFTAGVGFLTGLATTGILAGVCMSDANNDYYTCVGVDF